MIGESTYMRNYSINRELKCDVTKNDLRNYGICHDILKENVQDAYLPKIRISGQIVSEILAQLCSDDSIQILLNLTWVLLNV